MKFLPKIFFWLLAICSPSHIFAAEIGVGNEVHGVLHLIGSLPTTRVNEIRDFFLKYEDRIVYDQLVLSRCMLEDVQDSLKNMVEFLVTNITILYFGPENTGLAADALGKRSVHFAEIESAAREIFPGIQIERIELSSQNELPSVLNRLQF